MPVTLPNSTALGALDLSAPALSGLPRVREGGAGAVAAGIESIGAGIEKVDAANRTYQHVTGTTDWDVAKTSALTDLSKPESTANYNDLEQRTEDTLRSRAAPIIASISDPKARFEVSNQIEREISAYKGAAAKTAVDVNQNVNAAALGDKVKTYQATLATQLLAGNEDAVIGNIKQVGDLYRSNVATGRIKATAAQDAQEKYYHDGIALAINIAKTKPNPEEGIAALQTLIDKLTKARETSPAVLGAPGPQSSVEPGQYAQPDYIKRTFQIESGGNPNAVTGSNRGLGQFGPREEARFGLNDSNRTDPNAQARALEMENGANRNSLAAVLGREPSPADYYLAHQQGLGGATAHLSNPDRPAFASMASTAEGQQKGEGWARKAIWGNMTPEMKAQFPGGVDTVTSGDFTRMWAQRFNRQPIDASAPNIQTAGQPSGTKVAGASVSTQTDASMVPSEQQPSTPRDFYNLVGPLQRETLINTAQSAQNALVSQQETLANKADRELSRQQTNNFAQINANILQGKPAPTDDDLANALRTQTLNINQVNALRKTNVKDDVGTVLDLQRRINNGEDVSSEIDRASGDGHLTTKTALSMQKAIGSKIETPMEKAYFEQLKTIGNGNAIEKGIINLGNTEGVKSAARWAAMQGEWIDRVKIKREDPSLVYSDMSARWAPIVNDSESMPRPIFTGQTIKSGKIETEADLNNVATRTYQALQNKEISQHIYDREVNVLTQWRTYLKSQQKPIVPPPQKSGGARVLGRQPSDQ